MEVRHIVQRLNKLFSEVTEEQSSRDRFVSNAAHQLRNPILSAIQSLAEVAQIPDLPEAQKETQNWLRPAAHLSVDRTAFIL